MTANARKSLENAHHGSHARGLCIGEQNLLLIPQNTNHPSFKCYLSLDDRDSLVVHS